MSRTQSIRENDELMQTLRDLGVSWVLDAADEEPAHSGPEWDAAVNAEAAKYHESACSYRRQLSEALILISRVQSAPVRQGSADGRAFVYVEDLEIALEGEQ